ncbi:MAG: hypothetical protein ABI536_04200 [Gallionella sp.]
MMDAPAFDARWVRPALRFIVFCFSVVAIASMTLVKLAHADGQVDFINVYTINSGGFTNGCFGKASVAEAMQCEVDFVNSYLDGDYAQIASWGGYDIAICPRAVAHDLNMSNPYLYFFKVSPLYRLYAYMPPNPKIAVCNGGGEISASINVIPSSCPSNTNAGFPCTCKTGYVPDPTGTSCVPVDTCPAVTKLDDITDPVALKYVDGTYSSTNPDIEHLNQATQAGLACIVQKVVATNCYQTPQATSGYRPAAYQKHIYDVYYKWQKIKDNNTPECAEVKAAIKKQFDYHSPFRHAPGETSNHSQVDAQGNPAGNAVDIGLVPQNIADAIAGQCNMYRPMINMPNPKDNDPVHYQPK